MVAWSALSKQKLRTHFHLINDANMSARLFTVPVAPKQCLACGASTERNFFDYSSSAFEWGGHWYCNLDCFARQHHDRPVMIDYVQRVIAREKEMDDLAALMNGMHAAGPGGPAADMMMA